MAQNFHFYIFTWEKWKQMSTKHLYENIESNFICISQMGSGTNVPQYVDD